MTKYCPLFLLNLSILYVQLFPLTLFNVFSSSLIITFFISKKSEASKANLTFSISSSEKFITVAAKTHSLLVFPIAGFNSTTTFVLFTIFCILNSFDSAPSTFDI